ncbi:MAG: tol-pal system protein YbgF [bacterium]
MSYAERQFCYNIKNVSVAKVMVYVVMIGFILNLNACSSKRLANLERDVRKLNSRIDKEVVELKKEVRGLSGEVVGMSNLPERITKLEKEVEENTSLSDELNSKVQKMEAEEGSPVEQRISKLEQDLISLQRRIGGGRVQSEKNSGLTNEDNRSRTRNSQDRLVEAQGLYKNALNLFYNNDYGQAKQLFQDFLNKFPNTDLTDNSQYWLGECLFAEEQFQEAIDEFQKVISNYPEGNKLPDAVYMLGASYEKLGDLEKADKLYETVIDEYPKSEARKLAYIKGVSLRGRKNE